MSLNGGYAMIKYNSTQEELQIAYKSKRPALFYDENQRAHWAVIGETATQSVDEETQEPITLYKYSYRLLDEESGGSEIHLYEHHIYTKSQGNSEVLFVIYSIDNIPFTPDKIKQWLLDNNFTCSYRYYPASGYFTTGEVIIGIGASGQFIEMKTIKVNESNVLSTTIQNSTAFYALSDEIIQIL